MFAPIAITSSWSSSAAKCSPIGITLDQVAGQLALLASLSIRLVVVHGGGPQAVHVAPARDRTAYGRGRRVTDDAALEVVNMVGPRPAQHRVRVGPFIATAFRPAGSPESTAIC